MNVSIKGVKKKMKICVSSTGKDINASIDQRFGRCQYFLIIDVETMDVKTIPNESTLASGGAGVQAAQIVTNEDVDAIITGNIGPNAFQILQAAGITVFTGAQGSIKEAIENYKKGTLKETESPNVESHSGMKG
jgi:predicted Fe-Mo cluster-binding NifX family protein